MANAKDSSKPAFPPIDQAAVLPGYLVAHEHLTAAQAAKAQVQLLTGGVSNRTVLLTVPDGPSWVCKQALARLAVQTDWFADPARIHREAAGLRWLTQILPPGATPALVFEDFSEHLLGMTAVDAPHDNWKTRLLDGNVQAPRIQEFATLLAQIHRQGPSARMLFEDRQFFESLRLAPYYLFAAQREAGLSPFLRQLVADTRQIQETVVHGDYSPKNVLVARDRDGFERLVLLDHEVIHFGDGAFDVGFALTHLLAKAFHLTPHRQAFGKAAAIFWATYAQHSLPSPAFCARAVRHTLACLAARVLGRSPLEYLTGPERAILVRFVLHMTRKPPTHVPEFIETFMGHSDRSPAR